MKKEPLSVMTVKTLLTVLLFAGIGTIIIGGGYLIWEHYETPNNKIIEIIKENQKEKLTTDCKMDLDCINYLSNKTCEVLCVNNSKENQGIIDRFKKTCDSSVWDPPVFLCKCIDNKCQRVEEQNNTFNWQTYRNEEFGFEITLTDIWDGYKTITKSDGARTHVEFQIPTKDTNYGNGSGYATPFIISVYPILEWQKIQQDEGPKPKYIAQNDINVFAYSTWQDPPLDLLGKNIGFDQIISTFKFIEIEKPDTSNWQTYRNEEFGFGIVFDEEYKNIWESKTTNYTNEDMLARTDFYFKNYQTHIFSNIRIYDSEWFHKNSLIEEKYDEEMQKNIKIAWKNKDKGLSNYLGIYLGENDNSVFTLGVGPNGCDATESLCSLSSGEMVINSFFVIENDQPDTSDWQTYRNEEFGFEVKYPEEWNIYEDYSFPVFGIYKDEKGSFRNNNISIAPRGISTNAEPGKRQIIENPTQEIGKAVQLITKSGNPYSYNISFDDYPVLWGDDGFILANAETKNRKTECITDKGIQCSNFNEESEFTVLEADVNSEDWITINQILSTFKFIEN